MQAVVRTRHTNFRIDGDIDEKLMKFLTENYGSDIELIHDEAEQYVDISQTDWYKDVKAQMTAGKYMRIYRENRGWTQKQLGEELGGISPENVSHYENSRRPVSKKLAIKLSKLFNVSANRFLEE